MKNISIIIPNYNGESLLKENIPILLNALRNLKNRYEIIVVDDCSIDNSVKLLKEKFPLIKVIKTDKNSGFGSSCNLGVKESKYEIVYFLNTDVKVTKGFLESVLSKFDKADIFAVGSISKNDGISIPVVSFKFGMFFYKYIEFQPANDFIQSIFVSGGHSAFDKNKFLELGGFREIYSPFLWEDMDICYRAWKRGWGSFYNCKSLVYHKLGGTIKKIYDDNKISSIHWKNRFLFIWSNMGICCLIQHFLFLPFWLLVFILLGRIKILKGFFLAIPNFKKAFSLNKELFSFKDLEIIKKFGKIRI
jgi:GT2 family glycosyltransferase